MFVMFVMTVIACWTMFVMAMFVIMVVVASGVMFMFCRCSDFGLSCFFLIRFVIGHTMLSCDHLRLVAMASSGRRRLRMKIDVLKPG